MRDKHYQKQNSHPNPLLRMQNKQNQKRVLLARCVLAYYVLVIAYDVQGNLWNTRQPMTFHVNDQQTVHAYVGEIRLYQI